MSFFDDASWVLIPEGIKEDVVYAQKPTNGLGDLTFTRASDATRTNSAGVIERTPWNLVTWSEMFTDSSWLKTNSSISANTSIAPNGTLTADKLIGTGNNPVMSQDGFSINNTIATLSVYAKKGELNWIRLTNDSAAHSAAWFNLNTGTIGTVSGTAIPTATITSVGNGWYRCTMTVLFKNTSSFSDYLIGCTNADNTTTGYTGNGTDGIFIWGAQLVEGIDAKPYFATTNRQDVPRLHYRNADGTVSTCPRLLLEPQRTNIALQSEFFDNAAWAKTRATVTANAGISPDGYTNADKLIASVDNNTHFVQQSGMTVTAQIYSATVFVKKAGYDTVRLLLANLWSVPNPSGTFNLTTETVTLSGATGSIKDYGNGWYRCSITATANAIAGSNAIFQIFVGNNDVTSFAGNGTDGILIYGAQLEAGAYSTTYIPTTTAAVTRLADAASKAGVSSLIGQTEGTLFIEVNNRLTGQSSRVLQVSGATDNDRIQIATASNAFSPAIVTGGVVQATFSSAYTAGNNKVAIAYANNNVVAYHNGVQIGTDTSATIPACNLLTVGQTFGDGITQAALFTRRLTNAELAAITTL